MISYETLESLGKKCKMAEIVEIEKRENVKTFQSNNHWDNFKFGRLREKNCSKLDSKVLTWLTKF